MGWVPMGQPVAQPESAWVGYVGGWGKQRVARPAVAQPEVGCVGWWHGVEFETGHAIALQDEGRRGQGGVRQCVAG